MHQHWVCQRGIFFFPGKRFLQGSSTCKQNKRAQQGRGFMLFQSHIFPCVSMICQFMIQTKPSLAGFWSLDQAEISAGEVHFTVLSLPSHIPVKKAFDVPLSHWTWFVSPIKEWAALERRVSSLSQNLVLIKFPSWWMSEDNSEDSLNAKLITTPDFMLFWPRRWLGLIELCVQQSWC